MFYVNTTIPDSQFQTLQEAMDFADESAAYSQRDICITDDNDNEIKVRRWWGCVDGFEDQEDPLDFGNFGFYADWSDA